MLVFTWDGVGLGPDGTLWGGDALLGSPGQWQRVASLRPFKLPGSERAGREPWRSAAAICWEANQECPLDEASDPLLRSFWEQGKNAPLTTAAGRLFDAAAALTGVCSRASYEGQGPMLLETLARRHITDAGRDLTPTPMRLSNSSNGYIADWTPLILMLTDSSRPVAERAARFHMSLAHSLLQQAEQIRKDTGVNTIGLAGGVFQNRVLTEKCTELLAASGFQTIFPKRVPVNDAGISFGQIIEYGYSQNH